jgi:hypothetical protein
MWKNLGQRDKARKILGSADVDCDDYDKPEILADKTRTPMGWYGEIDGYSEMNLKALMKRLLEIKLNAEKNFRDNPGSFSRRMIGPLYTFSRRSVGVPREILAKVRGR